MNNNYANDSLQSDNGSGIWFGVLCFCQTILILYLHENTKAICTSNGMAVSFSLLFILSLFVIQYVMCSEALSMLNIFPRGILTLCKCFLFALFRSYLIEISTHLENNKKHFYI